MYTVLLDVIVVCPLLLLADVCVDHELETAKEVDSWELELVGKDEAEDHVESNRELESWALGTWELEN